MLKQNDETVSVDSDALIDFLFDGEEPMVISEPIDLDTIPADDSGEVDAPIAIDILPVDPVMDELMAQLDAIYGTPKTLTEAEQDQLDQLYQQIDSLYQNAVVNEVGEFEGEVQAQLDALYDQVNDLYGIRSYEDLSPEEQTQVDEIMAQLQGPKPDIDLNPDGEFEVDPEVQTLYDELDGIFGFGKVLSEEEQAQIDGINTQIDALLGVDGELDLTEEQHNELDALFDQMNDIYGIKTYDDLSDAEQARVEEIYSELDSHFQTFGEDSDLAADGDAPGLDVLQGTDLPLGDGEFDDLFPCVLIDELPGDETVQVSVDDLIGIPEPVFSGEELPGAELPDEWWDCEISDPLPENFGVEDVFVDQAAICFIAVNEFEISVAGF
ncbi:MAG: hypothetical protein MI864_09315 [Pseudomonadales bacterium]|nr:hypothetical protein [Pseudomonadales bacterium]